MYGIFVNSKFLIGTKYFLTDIFISFKNKINTNELIKYDETVKSPNTVTPAKAGVQKLLK